MSQLLLPEVLEALAQTLYMVFIASFLSVVLGLVLGVVTFLTRPRGLWVQPVLHRTLSFVINTVRSVPFIILLVALIPITRLIVGSAIGTNAAIVPLAIAAVPFFARITESALSEVDPNLVETSLAFGANSWQVVSQVYLSEALPSLIRGATLLLVSLIGYSAMAGTVGGGGLGDLAIRYGYDRFNVTIMIETVIILVILVQWVQFWGERFAKSHRIRPILIITVLAWVGCIGFWLWPQHVIVNQIKVGVIDGPSEAVLEVAKQVAKKRYHLDLEIVAFNDYILPNIALNNGNIDANIFQHVPFLDAQIKARGFHLTPIAKTFVYPMGFYSTKIHNIADLPQGALIAIPNDPSNESRALLILEAHHLIALKPGVGIHATLDDIVSNPYQLKFKLVDAAQVPRALGDVTLAGITDDYIKAVHLSISDALLKEGAHSPYANVIVVQSKDKNKLIFKQLVQVMHSKEVLAKTKQLYPKGASIPAWDVNKRVLA